MSSVEGSTLRRRRSAPSQLGAARCFGMYRLTFDRLAAEFAAPALTAQGLATAAGLAIEALCARIISHWATPTRWDGSRR